MKLFKRIAVVFAFILLVLVLGVYSFLRHSLAPLDGEIKLVGLSQKVTVTRDAFGIPHIKAANKMDALRALGYVMASERLFQMELARRLTHGRLSEIFGPLALPSDKLYRSLMLQRTTERMIEHLKKEKLFDDKTWQEMEAYYSGINQYVRTQPLPFEFTLLNIPREEFSPLDAYVMTGHMAYIFGIALKADPLMTELAKKLPKEKLNSLRTEVLKQDYQISQTAKTRPLPEAWEFFEAPFFEGSNSWLLSPDRSRSGKSLFANDPHISFSNPSIWVEAHIATPEFELYGHYLPLVPFAILGHSRQHAWGFTMSVVDDMDLFRETINVKNKTVLFKGKSQPYQEWTEVIKVKGEPDVVLEMIETAHGPLMNHALAIPNLSLKWAFHSLTNDVMRTLREIGEAHKISDFESALKRVAAPGLNVMYADPQNIAWWMIGDIALKKNPNSDLILDGASGADEFLSLLPWKDHPQSVNPPSGVIVTANSRPVSFPKEIRGDWQPDDRFETLTKILSEKQLWSADEFQKLQTLNFNQNTEVIHKILLAELNLSPNEQKEHQEILESFRKWNFHSETESVGAAVFHLWNSHIMNLLLADLTPQEKEIYLPTAAPWSSYKKILLDPRSTWFRDRTRSEIITQGFRNMKIEYPQIPTWGKLHTVEFMHPLGRMKPLDKIFNLGPYPVAGAYNEINNNKNWAFGWKDFKVTAGPSTRRIIDMAQPTRSWGVNPLGISGHVLSPYRADQVSLFLKGQYREQLMDEGDIQAVKTHELTLTPL